MIRSHVPFRSRELRLISRPHPNRTTDVFAIAETLMPAPAEGEVLVRNERMSLSVVVHELMVAETGLGPMPAYQLGAPPWMPTVATAIHSRHSDVVEGDLILHNLGFREFAIVGIGGWHGIRLDREALPTAAHFLLVPSGMTAWRGIVSLADVGPNDTVLVTGATTGVGSLAGQIAKCLGARVVGTTGTGKKIPFLRRLGFDTAINYKDGTLEAQLAEAAPGGITVVFDNVGGEQLSAAVGHAAERARVVLCGTLEASTSILDHDHVIDKEISIRGFISTFDPDDRSAFIGAISEWIAKGSFVFEPTVIKGGLESVPKAICDQLLGEHQGLTIIDISASEP